VAKGDDGWCAALDRDHLRCSIYELRPTICRGFDMGGYDCREERAAWYGKAAPQIPIVISNTHSSAKAFWDAPLNTVILSAARVNHSA